MTSVACTDTGSCPITNHHSYLSVSFWGFWSPTAALLRILDSSRMGLVPLWRVYLLVRKAVEGGYIDREVFMDEDNVQADCWGSGGLHSM
jgi:hypothetical protein